MVEVVAQSLLSPSTPQAQLPMMEMVVSVLLKIIVLVPNFVSWLCFSFPTVGPQNRSPRGNRRRMPPNDQQQLQQGIQSAIQLSPIASNMAWKLIEHSWTWFMEVFVSVHRLRNTAFRAAGYSTNLITKLCQPRDATGGCALMPLILGTEDIVCVWAAALQN